MSLAFSECTKCKRNKIGYICSWEDKFNYNCKNFTPKEKKNLADEMKQLADKENGNDFYSSLKKQIRKNALNGKYYIRVFKGASFQKFFKVLDNAHIRSGKNKAVLFCDIL